MSLLVCDQRMGNDFHEKRTGLPMRMMGSNLHEKRIGSPMRRMGGYLHGVPQTGLPRRIQVCDLQTGLPRWLRVCVLPRRLLVCGLPRKKQVCGLHFVLPKMKMTSGNGLRFPEVNS